MLRYLGIMVALHRVKPVNWALSHIPPGGAKEW